MGVAIREKRGKLYLDTYSGGKHHWQALGLTRSTNKATDREVLKMAEVIRARAEARLASGEFGLVDQVGGRQALIDYAEGIAREQRVKNHLPKALAYMRRHFGDRALASIDERDLEAFRGFLLDQPKLAQVTASHYFQALRTVLRRAERDRLILRSPGDRVAGIPVPEPVKVYLTAEELEALAAHQPGGELGAEIVRGFFFACMVGLRKSDIASLAWGDIRRGDEPRILKRQQKTGTVVGIPINASAWAIIDDRTIHAREELVFPRLSSSKTDPATYFRAWEELAGLDKRIGWHTARHTFAVLSLEGGADLYTVSKLLGHTSIKTTQVYAKVTDRLKREAVDNLPRISLEGRAARGRKG